MRAILVVFIMFSIVLVKSASTEKKEGEEVIDKEEDVAADKEGSEEESDSESSGVSSEETKTEDQNKVEVTKKTPIILHTETPESNREKTSTTTVNYPFSVSIQRKGSHYANGALIGKKWILTCAGEFYNVRESIKLYRVRLGSVDCKRGGRVVPVKSIEIHPSYKYGRPDYDLAVVKIASTLDFSDYIKPIGLSNVQTKIISAKFMVTYWPRLIVRGQVLPPDAPERVKPNSMRVSTQRLIPREACSLRLSFSMEDFTLCLNPFASHHTTCVPDSGAPVVAEDGLWGITSGWTSGECNVTQSPTVFTRISEPEIRSWLDSQIDDNV